jgi:RNA polymerase sigma factor (sigma-70 family)
MDSMPTMVSVDVDSPASALARLAAGDDAEAWRYLVDEEGSHLYRAAWQVLGEHAAAEDAVQEALLHVRRSASRFTPPPQGDPDDAARAWLYRVAISAARMWARGERRRRNRELATSTPVTPRGADGRITDLRHAIADLPEAQRLPLIMHHLGGHDYDAVGAALGISPGAARVRVHRGMERLRQRLAGVATIAVAGALLDKLAASDIATPAAAFTRWQAALSTTLTPAVSTTAIFGGLTTMTKLSIACAAVLSTGLLAVTTVSASAEEGRKKEDVRREEPRKENVEVAKPENKELKEGTKGSSTGEVVSIAKGKLVLATKEGKLEFVPHWRGGMPKDGGGFDKETLAQLDTVKPGDHVTIVWIWQERRRINSIEKAK